MIAELFLSFLEISISTSLIILLLLLLTPLFMKRYAAKWKYWIWILIALRLVMPYNVADGASFIRTLSQSMAQTEAALEKAYADSPPNLSEQRTVPRAIVIELPAQMTSPIAAQAEKSSSGITMLDLAAYGWMFGVLLFLSVHLLSYLRYKSQVAKRGVTIKDTDILLMMLALKHELHIKCTVHVMKYSGAGSPMVMGFFRHVLILPDEQYSPEELFFILKHEMVHLKRKDVCLKLLFVMANAVHWFNPLIWFMQKEAEVDMELSCDERVTQDADYATRKAYTETLLSTLSKQCAKRKLLSTQFYGEKQIMQKRFQNILIKTRKRNGAVLLLFAAVLTISLGTLVGCSVGKENLEEQVEGIPLQTENGSLPEEDASVSSSNEPEDGTGNEDVLQEDVSGKEAVAENTRVLTIMKEGEPEEKQATLVVDQTIYHEFSFYLPDGEWQKKEAATWQAVANENVRLWAACFEKDYDIDVEQLLENDGYEEENGEFVRQEEEIIYKTRLYEDGDNIWWIEYCYPAEAEEGWGRELPVIADTFAVIAPAAMVDGYISAFDNGFVTIDEQIWATVGSEYWKPEYNEDAGFEIVDAEGEDITYPLHEDCTFFILENHYDPTIELSENEFADYLTEMEYPVLWIFELEDGQIKSIVEQYIP